MITSDERLQLSWHSKLRKKSQAPFTAIFNKSYLFLDQLSFHCYDLLSNLQARLKN